MPALPDWLTNRAGLGVLHKRLLLSCCNDNSPPGLVEASELDPWEESDKYALAWVYFSIGILVTSLILRLYHLWNDKVRIALRKQEHETAASVLRASPPTTYEASVPTGSSQGLFPRDQARPPKKDERPSLVRYPIFAMIAVFRYVFYRRPPQFHLFSKRKPFITLSLPVIALIILALALGICYSFVPQPLFWRSMRFGSPPLAIRSGMIAIAMLPWIIALSTTRNFITMVTGLGHERLNVLHRWAAYIFLILSVLHTLPFYLQPIWDPEGNVQFQQLLRDRHISAYGTGIAALVPLVFLCVHSLPALRRRFYELFVFVHIPVSILLLAMLFWHCRNFLTSWHYLYASSAIWILSYIFRLFKLNWINPIKASFLAGDEATVTLLQGNAMKITIATREKWKPGQYVYIRMPGIALFQNHPFTIASLCSDDLSPAHEQECQDMVLVFRPFKGFTSRVVDTALEHGPWKTYRAFLDGPYGGCRRRLDAFDHVVMIAGGSGITAIVSQLLDLVQRMRDGKAVTKTVQLIWAMKRPEAMEWFKQELRICYEFAPAASVRCQFYITAAKRQGATGHLVSAHTPTRPVSMLLHDKVNDMFQSIADHRSPMNSPTRNSAMIREEAQGDAEREKELRNENSDRMRPLPQARLKTAPSFGREAAWPPGASSTPSEASAPGHVNSTPALTLQEKRRGHALTLPLQSEPKSHPPPQFPAGMAEPSQPAHGFDFGFPSTPTEFQKNLMRFAFMPAAVKAHKQGWSTEWGRPQVAYMLREASREWTGRRACIFVCGPPSMRNDACGAVANLQTKVLSRKMDEIYMHTESYSL